MSERNLEIHHWLKNISKFNWLELTLKIILDILVGGKSDEELKVSTFFSK